MVLGDVVLFRSWSSLLRVLLVGVPAYVALLVMLRISGNRSLSKFNAFDLITTVAFGSALSSAFVQSDLPLANIVATFMALIFLQYAITWVSVRSEPLSRVVRHKPRLLFDRGFLRDSMREARVTEAAMLAAIRANGIADPADVRAIVLEADGSFSVVTGDDPVPKSLQDVRRAG